LRSTGLAFLINDSLNYRYACSSYTSFESFAITIHFGHRILTVFNIYRPDSDNGHTEQFTTFIDQFQSFLAVAATAPHDFIITGDFNIHVNKSDSRSSQFLDILNSHNLIQLVSFPTHTHATHFILS
jgi:exonuclease III